MSFFFQKAAVCLLLTSAAQAAFVTTCAANACLQAVEKNYRDPAPKKPAPDECGNFLNQRITPQPETVTHTATLHVPAYVTDTDTSLTVRTVSSYVSETASSALPATASTTVVVRRGDLDERAAGSTCPTPSQETKTIPTYASACHNSAAFSSACSCVGITGRTKTLPACTTTVHSTYTKTVTHTKSTETTETSTSVHDIPTTITTQYLTPTPPPTTVTEYSTAPMCSRVTMSSGGYYMQYYAGSGYVENANNPGNGITNVFPPITTTFAGSSSPCDVANACATAAYYEHPNPNEYFSFDLHYLANESEWQCVQYYNQNNQPGYFDVADSNVVVGYGFTFS